MSSFDPFEWKLLPPESTLDKMERAQNRILKKTAQLHDEKPVYPKKPYWARFPPKYEEKVGAVEEEKYDPSGLLNKEITYNYRLMFKSLFDPTILIEVAEHEGIHAGTPGKMLLSYLYYDFRDGHIKFGPIEPEYVPKFKYPVGEAIKEGGVKVISKK